MPKKGHRLVVLVVLLATACGGNQGGTLEPVIDPEGEIAGFGDFTTAREKTFGIFVCSRDGSVEIDSVDAGSIEGGVEFLGGMVYTSSEKFVGAANGYPAEGLDEDLLQPVAGATIETDCDNPEGEDRVQLLIGAERTSVGGGMIEGIRVATSAGTVNIDFTILMCGDELEFCDVLLQPESSAHPPSLLVGNRSLDRG